MSDAVCTSKRASNRLGVIGSLATAAVLALGLSVPASAGLYGGVGSYMVSSDIDLDRIAATSGTTNGLITDDPRDAIRFFGGYALNDFLSVEGGYSDVGTIFAAVGSDYYNYDISGIDVSVLGRLPLFKFLGQPIGFYVKVGAMNWKSTISVNRPGSVTRTDEDGTDLVYGGGMEILLFKHILVRGGLDMLDIDPADAGAGNITLGGVQFALYF